ncbi:MAG: 2-oxoglutarate ferredoxin oxidoreductase subunit alpha [Candidatus Lindowbacteria bacterium RIFCSPLOWO2_12_FULL_62_27]|nr:MAG: 2-oxoglutarate ferredoxin oxidoreductase subunit alpha [Candidatus Lindowbacteria bacterium RIFCSPLOWO2_02_FULL_62_12]OGH63249.1 MAG: 2-oxoglutarate ferredoxin oxidoreductase subunit alpha [Candidatus Lindowbacteria bacterium RIFCSPLOWO2_12_FULL_62_27]
MSAKERRIEDIDHIVIRFAGDSGDGMQLTGTQFTDTSAILGNDISTLPDFPAEIRAPAGSLAGVSGYQVNFSNFDIRTPGDAPNVLVVMNPAALKTNVGDLEPGGILISNSDAFVADNLRQAGYTQNPLEDGTLRNFRLYKVPITKLVDNALKENPLSFRQKERCKNFFALGLVYWMFNRPMESTLKWIQDKFKKNPDVLDANTRALNAGFYYGETTEAFETRYQVRKAMIAPGTYRKITGNEALALGLMCAAERAGKHLFMAGYPITPASDILHELSKHRRFGVKTFQAEDEISAIGAAIGAAFGGAMAVTASSGPGIALKTEAMGLAIMLELPLVICNIQRGGPSTGLPTKTEQADLLQAMFGRNSESPLAVIAPATPGECFTMAFEAFRIAVKYMTPVMVLSDGYLANGAEPWAIPKIESLPVIPVHHPTSKTDGAFLPYQRDPGTLARPWAVPGTAGFEHRIGGIEKADVTGNVSYDPDNHEHMVRTRKAKIDGIANDIPHADIFGSPEGDLLVVGWGSTYGAIVSAVEKARAEGLDVSALHLRYLNPFPKNLGDALKRFRRVLVPEMNLGQLRMLLRAEFLVDAIGLNKVKGQPFKIAEIGRKIHDLNPKQMPSARRAAAVA